METQLQKKILALKNQIESENKNNPYKRRLFSKGIDLESFIQLDSANGLDHQRLHFFQDLIEFKIDESCNNERAFLHLDEIEIADIEISNIGDFSSVPLFICRAFSNRLQNIFYKKANKNEINLSRLKQLSNKEFTFNDISTVPHPIG